MPLIEFHPTTTASVVPVTYTDNPYFKVRVDAIANDWYHNSYFKNWSRTSTPNTITNSDWVGLNTTTTTTSLTFSKTINFPSDGYYKIEVFQRRDPSYRGTVSLEVDDVDIGNPESAYIKYAMAEMIEYPVTYFQSGDKDLEVILTKSAYVSYINIYKINRFEGGTENTTDKSSNRLDLKKGESTLNSVNETNRFDFNILFKESYYDTDNPNTGLCFDQFDSVTLWAGNSQETSRVIFGGYIASLEHDKNTLLIKCMDRLMDLRLAPIYMNFKISNPTITDTTDTTPYTSFSNVYDLARFLCAAPEYPLKSYMVPFDYGFHQTFDTIEEYNTINTSIWEKEYDTQTGHPAPSLKLGIGDTTGTGTCTIYTDDDGYDAYTYGYLNIDYYTNGMGITNPLPWNLKIKMHKNGETISDAITYTIRINDTGGTNVLGSYNPKLNGAWQHLTINLKDLFDKKANSSTYTVTEIRLEGTVTQSMVDLKCGYNLWIDQCNSYRSIANSPKYASADVKTPFEELQQLCERTNHSAYVRYGEERRDDILVMQPTGNTVNDTALVEGINVSNLTNWSYNPNEDIFANIIRKNYSWESLNKKKETVTNYGSVTVSDYSSINRYRRVQTHEFLEDVNNKTDATSIANNELSVQAWKYPSYTISTNGCLLCEPSQYSITSVGSHRINGTPLIKSIIYTLDFENNKMNTQLDLNRPSRRFNNFINRMSKDLKHLSIKNSTQVYLNNSIGSIGGVSPGAFNQGG